MKALGLSFNDIGDDGADSLMKCLAKIKDLLVRNCGISAKKQGNLREHAHDEGCAVLCE